jgi:hypothetical protein
MLLTATARLQAAAGQVGIDMLMRYMMYPSICTTQLSPLEETLVLQVSAKRPYSV